MVPGTMEMLHSRARAWYPAKNPSERAHAPMKSGCCGTQEVRWYSGRTARWQPAAAAARMAVEALVKFCSGSMGYVFVIFYN